jgi:cytochrome c556
MKLRCAILLALAVSGLLTGCATTDDNLSQKERDKMAREMEKADRKRAQEQSKMMRDSGQRRTSR